jgi:transposase
MSQKEGVDTKLAVGVDVGKYELVAAIWLAHEKRAEGIGAFPNNPEGIEQLIGQAEKHHKALGMNGVHVTVEPTGKYEICLITAVYQRKWQVSVVTPTTVRDFAGTLRRRAKTDQQDALVLAQYTAERHPSAWTPPSEALDDLDALLSRRCDLVSMLQAERNRQSSFASRGRVAAAVQHTVDDTIEHLEKSLRDIDQAIADLIDQDPPLAENAEFLDSIPGIGPKTVPPILAVITRYERLTQGAGNHRGLTAFVGLDARVFQSGTSVRKKGLISKKGDPTVRAALYQSALGAIRGKNAVHEFYDRLVASGKPKLVALVACAHKILIWAWHVFSSKKPYDPSLHAKPA